jgi:hypothetical protein
MASDRSLLSRTRQPPAPGYAAVQTSKVVRMPLGFSVLAAIVAWDDARNIVGEQLTAQDHLERRRRFPGSIE